MYYWAGRSDESVFLFDFIYNIHMMPVLRRNCIHFDDIYACVTYAYIKYGKKMCEIRKKKKKQYRQNETETIKRVYDIFAMPVFLTK